MSSIDIDDSLWGDYRFQNLIMHLGDRHKAIGMMVDLWTHARAFWIPDRKLIPAQLFQDLGLSEFIILDGLAERLPEGVYARGAKEYFDWWFKRQAAGRTGGINSGISRRSKPKQTEANRSKPKQKEPPVLYPAPVSGRDFNSDSDIQDPSDLDSVPDSEFLLKLEKREKERSPKVTVSPVPSFDFESLYKEYPLKRGKARGLKICEAKIKTTEDYNALRNSIRKYKQDCERTGTYVQHFSTFMNGEWEDWLDPETGSGPDRDNQVTDWVKVLESRKVKT